MEFHDSPFDMIHDSLFSKTFRISFAIWQQCIYHISDSNDWKGEREQSGAVVLAIQEERGKRREAIEESEVHQPLR